MKKLAIFYSEYTPTIDAIKHRLNNVSVSCFKESENSFNPEDFDLVILSNYNKEFDGEAVAVHHSLLPAFNTEEPLKDAVLAGVKITGLTVYYKKSGKIIAQYPVFISNERHYDELKQELDYIEQTLYPLVAEKLLNNEIIDSKELLNTNKGCLGGCRGCSH